MKSKFVFIVLLLAFFLNITHDLIVPDHLQESKNTLTINNQSTTLHSIEQHNTLSNLHKFFHIHALINIEKLDIQTNFYEKVSFFTKHFSVQLPSTTFRPPIS